MVPVHTLGATQSAAEVATVQLTLQTLLAGVAQEAARARVRWPPRRRFPRRCTCAPPSAPRRWGSSPGAHDGSARVEAAGAGAVAGSVGAAAHRALIDALAGDHRRHARGDRHADRRRRREPADLARAASDRRPDHASAGAVAAPLRRPGRARAGRVLTDRARQVEPAGPLPVAGAVGAAAWCARCRRIDSADPHPREPACRCRPRRRPRTTGTSPCSR